MWKQQDSLEGPAAEKPSSPEASGSEEGPKDSNPLLERLRALEVGPPLAPEFHWCRLITGDSRRRGHAASQQEGPSSSPRPVEGLCVFTFSPV